MRYLLSTFFFVLLFSVLHGQKTRNYSLVLGADYLHRDLSINENFFEESPRLHFRLGGDFSKDLSARLALRTGLRFTNFRYDSGTEPIVTQATIPIAFGGQGLAEDPEFGPTIRTRTSDYFAEIPLVIRYQKSKESRFYLEGGIATYVYLSSYTHIEVRNPSKGWARIVNMDAIMPVAQVAAGWAWPWRDNKAVFLQPTLRYFFNKSENLQMMGGGLEMGIRW